MSEFGAQDEIFPWDLSANMPMPEGKTFIGTFGMGHANAGKFVEFEAESESDARQKMFDTYSQKWAFIYESREEAGVERWGYEEIQMGSHA